VSGALRRPRDSCPLSDLILPKRGPTRSPRRARLRPSFSSADTRSAWSRLQTYDVTS